MGELAERYQIDLIGGDTVSTNDSLTPVSQGQAPRTFFFRSQ